jgi:transaldolase/glucose-6-phosphate isomerase
MSSPIQEAQAIGQSIWYDNIRRGLIKSGELERLIALGVTGVTSNPTIFEKAIAGSTDYDEALLKLAQGGKPAQETFEALALEDIQATADLLRPVYDRTGGTDGFASLEVSPHLAHDTECTVAEARRLFAALDRPNVMVKVPATPEGIPAIRRLIREGINVNVTLIFSLDVYEQVTEAYISGLEELASSGRGVSKVASVASFFVSRVDTVIDGLLEEGVRGGREELKNSLGKAAIANARLAYQAFKSTFYNERFAALREKGAQVQRPLWASTGTKNPTYSDVLYVETLIGPDTVNTVPESTLASFLEHGRAGVTLEEGIEEAGHVMETLANSGISMEQITAKLLADGVEAFADSFQKLMANIEDKKARLLAREHEHPGISLGNKQAAVEATLDDLQQQDVIRRIWHRDHTVWKPDPTEITDRLGWLTVTDMMCEHTPKLEAFAREVIDSGFRHVVLLGMGGSSLGPEVLRQTFGSTNGYPELMVLDSTIPDSVQAASNAIDPAQTLFVVSSKSGSTTEPNTFYAHFRTLVERQLGEAQAGRSFIAITDAGTPLEKLAQEKGFRHLFLNPTDIGGRYSALSYFGLVPAALMGINISRLLDRADCMREGCAFCVPAHDNPGAWLGAVMGVLAGQGRDKLTLVTSPSISSFGLWVEQLIAESTGKEGKGIVPISTEPLMSANSYGSDRLFVHLRLERDDNSDIDNVVEQIGASGQPVVRLELRDKYDLGAEFYRWEFATGIAGSLLGIHPFDQPNVQGAKDMTERVLAQYQATRQLPKVEAPSAASAGSILRQAQEALEDLLAQAGPGDYLAIMAYLRQTPEVDNALAALRRKVMELHGIATTVGFGPRFLHSTGQLHKGGPASGLFLQLTADQEKDVPVPGQAYSFGVLAQAQSQGDLEALQEAGRRVVRVHLGSDTIAGLTGMLEVLE